ncbi:MAG: 5-formyltetrahydrofolate cyclo-ligase, partial [Planctomycetota bacterium]
MTRTLRQRKSDLRRALAARIDALAPAVRQRHDAAIRNRVLALPELAAAGACLGYVPLPDEIDTLPLVQTLLERGVRLDPRLFVLDDD